MVALVAAEVVHESVENPPLKGSDAEFAESEQVGTESGITGAGGGGGGGIGVGMGMDGSEQQGGATCANTCAGVMAPVTNAIIMPKNTIADTVSNPLKSGFIFLCELVVYSFMSVCTKKGVVAVSLLLEPRKTCYCLGNFDRSIALDPHTGHS